MDLAGSRHEYGLLVLPDGVHLKTLLAAGFRDTWRDAHPDEAKYSWWSYRMAARERNVGWRIDYFLVSESLAARVAGTDIHNEIFGSDHCPVELVLNE